MFVPEITVETLIEAPATEVWNVIEDIAGHVNWMDDAVAIHFVGNQQLGIGTVFACETRIGPFKLVDRMEITEWADGRTIGITHEGLVSGSGNFILTEMGKGQTKFTWDESLNFPFWMGGPFRNFFGQKILGRVWAQNLKNLKTLIEEGRPTDQPSEIQL